MNKVVLGILLVTAFATTSCRYSMNFQEVDKGKFFRSAQLTKKELIRLHERTGLKTIINLRGARPGKEDYEDEKAFAEEYGVALHDIANSSKRIPHKKDLHRLLDVYESAERPILVHCAAGADRTSWASAIYTMEYMGWSHKRSLKKMISKAFFHFKEFTPAPTYFFKLYQGMDWAYNDYDPCKANYKHYDKSKYCDADGVFIEGLEEILTPEEDS